MRPQVATTSNASGGTVNSLIASFDGEISPFNVSVGIVVTGTVAYNLQHTFDNIMTVAPGSITWFPHDDSAFTAATASGDTNFGFPVTGARIQQTSGSGSIAATFKQAGLPNV